jgi:hypothetical protein
MFSINAPDTPEFRILDLKNQLQQTDYKAIKYAEGWLTEEEYAEVKAERQCIRDEINRLEKEAKEGGKYD